jgi:hypothetical protein
MERFILNEAEGKEQYHVKISGSQIYEKCDGDDDDDDEVEEEEEEEEE